MLPPSPQRDERDRRRNKPSRLNKCFPTATMAKKRTPISIPSKDFNFEDGKVSMELVGEPKSWLRCTPIRGTNKMHNTNAACQQSLQSAIKRAIGTLDVIPVPVFPPDMPLALTITFFLGRPQQHFGQNQRRINTNIGDRYSRIIPTKAPDIDNLIKFIMDTPFKGVLISDDKVVSAVFAKKRWDSKGGCHGRTVLTLEEDIDDDQNQNN